MYVSLKVTEVNVSSVGPENDRGTPRRNARTAAREKLRTDVADMMVDAKQRLNDFKSIQIGAAFLVSKSILSMNRGANNIEQHEKARPSNLGRIRHEEMKYKGTPQACVARMISTACDDGRLLCSHFMV